MQKQGTFLSTLLHLVRLMLSIVSECHQFTVIKLIRPAVLIVMPKNGQQKQLLVAVDCLGKHPRELPLASFPQDVAAPLASLVKIDEGVSELVAFG